MQKGEGLEGTGRPRTLKVYSCELLVKGRREERGVFTFRLRSLAGGGETSLKAYGKN